MVNMPQIYGSQISAKRLYLLTTKIQKTLRLQEPSRMPQHPQMSPARPIEPFTQRFTTDLPTLAEAVAPAVAIGEHGSCAEFLPGSSPPSPRLSWLPCFSRLCITEGSVSCHFLLIHGTTLLASAW